MGVPPSAVCKACGYELGPPSEEVYNPEEDKGNPDGHFKEVSGEKGKRLQCKETGQMTKVLEPDDPEHPANSGDDGPDDDRPHGGGTGEPQTEEKPPDQSEPNSEADRQPPPDRNPPDKSGGVYDIQEDKTSMDVLQETVTNPSYGLNDDQINEIRDWAEIYDGQIPPNLLEDVLSNMSGVAKQTAQLVRQKYEAKLNRWVRDQTSGDGGPPIGAVPRPPESSSTSPQELKRRKQQMQASKGDGPDSQPQPSPSPKPDLNGSGEGDKSERPIKKRQERAFERRNNAIDAAIEQAAPEMAAEMTSRMGKGYDLIFTLLESKARKDPEWFFEKAEQFDIDLFEEFMEPSDALREEQEQEQGSSAVDREIDDIMDEMGGGGGGGQPRSQPQQEQDPSPAPKPDAQQDQGTSKEGVEGEGPHWKGDSKDPAVSDGGDLDEPDNEELDDELEDMISDLEG